MYWIILGVFICIQTVRVVYAVLFHRSTTNRIRGQTQADQFTVIQPIVSGDPELEYCLKANLETTSGLKFIWVVDDHDHEAARITKKISAAYGDRIQILVVKDIPKEKNEKVWKQKLALPYAADYVLCLDDDVVMDFDGLDYVKDCLDKEKSVVFGIPRYRTAGNFFSNLVVGFVNGNTLLTYPILERLKAVDSLMGACYAFRKAWFSDNRIFERVENMLSDEYEIARALEGTGIGIRQIELNFSPGTVIHGFNHYVNLMKRWMIFANIYLKDKIRLSTFLTIVLPTILPLILLAVGISEGVEAVAVLVAVFIIQAAAVRKLQKLYGLNPDSLKMMPYEILAQILQPLHYLHSILRPGTVVWRKNLVKIDRNGSMTYERVKNEK